MLLADTVDQACGVDRDPWLCRVVGNATDNVDAANVAEVLSPWVSTLLIVVAALIVNRVVRRAIRHAVGRWETVGSFTKRGRTRLLAGAATPDARRHQRAVTIARGYTSLATIIVWIVAVGAILAVFGISGAAVLTSAGLIGVALAFGAQNLLRDLIAGTFMIFEDQVGVGDVIDVGVANGTVEDVSLRSTRIRDVEGVVWYVPNGVIQRVGNKSQQWSHAVIDIPVAAGTDVDTAQAIIAEVAHAMASEPEWAKHILDAPEVWGVESFTIETITIRLVVKTAPHEQGRVARELRGHVKVALDAAGIVSIPAPETSAPEPDQ